MPDVLTAEEAAEYLRLPESTLLSKVRAGLIPAVKIGRVWRFSQRQLLAWLEREADEEEEDRALAAATMAAFHDPANQERIPADEVEARLVG
jgi:excisionase family DNA binding protein